MKLRVPPAHLEALGKLLHLPDNTMEGLAKALNEEPPALSLRKLADRLAQKLKLDRKEVRKLLEVITGLYVSSKRPSITLQDFLESLRHAIKETGRPDLQLADAEWNKFADHLSRIFACEKTLGVTSKALSVMIDHSHVFRDGRVLTDLRPIFASNPEEPPKAAVIIHSLKIEYLQDSEDKEFFVALDSKDLKQLEALIKRAKSKENALKAALKTSDMYLLDAD